MKNHTKFIRRSWQSALIQPRFVRWNLELVFFGCSALVAGELAEALTLPSDSLRMRSPFLPRFFSRSRLCGLAYYNHALPPLVSPCFLQKRLLVQLPAQLVARLAAQHRRRLEHTSAECSVQFLRASIAAQCRLRLESLPSLCSMPYSSAVYDFSKI